MSIKEKFSKKLLVEGSDDQHVIWALCEKFQIIENFDVIDCKGIGLAFDQFSIRFKQSGVQTIGLIVDADVDINVRWNSIKQILTKQGYTVPTTLPLEGLILSHTNNIKVGIWIMPNNNLSGMLEDFISFLVPKEDELIKVVDRVLNQIEDQNLNKYKDIHKSKATIHSWLAWQEDPGTPMGLSITKRYLTTDAEHCQRFIKWIKDLFS